MGLLSQIGRLTAGQARRTLPQLEKLTPMETEILTRLQRGMPRQALAAELFPDDPRTLDVFLHKLQRKLNSMGELFG